MYNQPTNMLVADDHRLFIQGVKLVLKEELGVENTDYAVNGKEAIDLCRPGRYDVVLMDINMPVIDGIRAVQAIRQQDSEVKIIMVSMLSDYSSVIKALKAGANGYILKHSGVEELLIAIKTVLKGDTYITQSLSELVKTDASGKPITTENYIRFFENLITPREQEILKQITEGSTDKEIANILYLSVKTVSTHRKNMLAKLNLPNTAALVKLAIDNKLA